jgi:hypothetical protein
MAIYDILLNADNVPFDEIIKRQASVHPYYDLSDVEHGDPALGDSYKKRYEFLQRFYVYAGLRLKGYSGTWSDWIK